MHLKELVSVVEGWEESAQKALWNTLKELLTGEEGEAEGCGRPNEAVESGILTAVGDGYVLSEPAREEGGRLYTYLERKFGITLYFDPDKGGAVEVPTGSDFAPVLMIMGGDGRMPLCFPKDEITDLLNQYGANRCDNWYING